MIFMTSATIDAYDHYAQLYDQEVIEFWEMFPKTTLEAFRSRLAGPKVLDLGSGSGRDALLLRDLGLEATCVDASIEMVKMTHKLGFESIHADFETMDFTDGAFDGVWAYTSLIHVASEQVTAALKKVHRYLQPQGVLAIGVIIGDGEAINERKSMPGAKRYFKYYSADELEKLVTSEGFTLEYSETYDPPNNPKHHEYLTQVFRKI